MYRRAVIGMKRRFRLILITSILLLGVLPVLVVGILLYYDASATVTKNLKKEQLNIVELARSQINGILSNYEGLISQITDSSAVRNMDQNQTQSTDYFDQILKNYPEISNVYVGTASGQMVLRPQQTLPGGYDPRVRPWYEEAINSSRAIVTQPYLNATKNVWTMTFAKKVYAPSGNLIGVAGIDLFTNQFNQIIKNAAITKNSYIAILSATGTVIVDPDPKLVGINLAQYSWGKKIVSEGSGSIAYALEGVKKYATFDKLSNGWIVTSITPVSDISAENSSLLYIFLTVLAIVVALAILISILLISMIIKPINQMTEVADKFGQNDFRIDLDVKRKDEIGTMMRRFKDAIASIRGAFKKIEGAAEKVGKSSEEVSRYQGKLSESVSSISNSSRIVSDNVNNAASGLEEINASIEEISSASQTLATAAQNASDSIEKMTSAVSTLNSMADNTKNAINKTKDFADKNASISQGLSEASNRIGDIVGTIDKIAEQTNLLALNAAIEAARAGDAGKGFAVVADEIRKLAEETTKSTTTISEIINDFKDKTNESIEMGTGLNETISETVNEVNTMISEFKEISESISLIASTIQNVAAASEEQSASTQEITAGTTDVTQKVAGIGTEMETLLKVVEDENEVMKTFERIVSDLAEAYSNYEQVLSSMKY